LVSLSRDTILLAFMKAPAASLRIPRYRAVHPIVPRIKRVGI